MLAHPLQAGEPGGYVDPRLALFFPFAVWLLLTCCSQEGFHDAREACCPRPNV